MGEDQLKSICAGGCSSGCVTLFHIVGLTPEAPSLEVAFQGREPAQTIEITLADLREARSDLSTTEGEELDIVVLGSPHFSLAEFRRLAPLLQGRRCHPEMQFLVTSNRTMVKLAREAGLLEALEEFGGKITVDTCIITTPMLAEEVETIMTNSAKYAYYSPGLLDVDVAFGSLEDCVQSAIEGRVTRELSPWEE
jgi:predicted aconitase